TVTPEAASRVTVTPAQATLRVSNLRQLTAVARNGSDNVITGRTFRWSSSNSSVATVDQNGNVIAVAPGNAVVSAEVDQASGSSAITVTAIPIQQCSLSPTTNRVTVGQSVQPGITIRDSAGGSLPLAGRGITWSSSNEVVATVSQTGLVTTRRAGTATITASSNEYPAVNCQSTVEAVDPRIDRVIITPKVGTLRLGIPRFMLYSLVDSVGVVIPPGRTVTWRTPDAATLRVSQLGEVTGLALGTGRVIVTSEGVSDTATLTVTKIPVATVVLTPVQSTITEGQTTQLRAIVTDSTGAEVTDRPLDWTTTDPTRATVSQSGLVTGVSAGSVTISAVATQDNRVGQANVIIQQIPVDTILTADSLTVNLGTVGAFAITVRDAQGRTLLGRNVLVTSDFPGIAIGAANAQATQVNVNGLALGTARLTLQAVDSNNRAQGKASRVVITVQRPPTTTPVRQGNQQEQ
ncbi:MAG TPA: Ig-like domain-containing protein, partial [Gemmatimonas sp.]|uniref:Ig-like domain-containing protein n=1 Tax=Gemmatimonas sp. TaxID=1962908 RepID=UPI002ED83E51